VESSRFWRGITNSVLWLRLGFASGGRGTAGLSTSLRCGRDDKFVAYFEIGGWDGVPLARFTFYPASISCLMWSASLSDSRAHTARDQKLAYEIADISDLRDKHNRIGSDQMTVFEGRIDGGVKRKQRCVV
jgi:hypothetical protein